MQELWELSLSHYHFVTVPLLYHQTLYAVLPASLGQSGKNDGVFGIHVSLSKFLSAVVTVVTHPRAVLADRKVMTCMRLTAVESALVKEKANCGLLRNNPSVSNAW